MSNDRKKPENSRSTMTIKLIVLVLAFIAFAILAGLLSDPRFWHWSSSPIFDVH
ncbi:MAG TPA: hypothetical protein VGH74_09215 [Planctomycetaceae bacterium]|jgi:hypothetical protein